MKIEEQLVEDYWKAMYTGDTKTLEGMLAPDIKVTIISPNGSERYLYSSEELISIAKNVSGKVESVLKSNRVYHHSENELKVDFTHLLKLKTGSLMDGEGYQKWTVKTSVDGKIVLASLEVKEKASLK